MTPKEKEILDEAKESIIYLETMFNSRIVEMNNVKGEQAERHAFLYYREIIWKLKTELNKL